VFSSEKINCHAITPVKSLFHAVNHKEPLGKHFIGFKLVADDIKKYILPNMLAKKTNDTCFLSLKEKPVRSSPQKNK
jgi:hypothetical protein